jgi:ABC-2 type transport system permease protein
VILTLTMVFTGIATVRSANAATRIADRDAVRHRNWMIAKIVPYLGIGLLQVTVILPLGRGVQRTGRRIANDVLRLAVLAASLGIGLFISTISQTQFQAIQMMFFVLLPSILISGFVFPFEGMPVIVQRIAETLPMTHFVRLIKGIMLRGATLTEMAPSMWALAITAVVVTGGAMLRFKKRID